MTDWNDLGPKLLAAAKGARDTLNKIPEDLKVPGMISQGQISRTLARLEIAINRIEGANPE